MGWPTADIDKIRQLTITTGICCLLVQLAMRDRSGIQEEQGNKKLHESILQKLPHISQVMGIACSFGYHPRNGDMDKSLLLYGLKLDLIKQV